MGATSPSSTMAAYQNVRFLTSANKVSQLPPDTGAEVAVAGRSNAGKSSAINAITQRKGLARTSKTPGATRLHQFFRAASRHADSLTCRATDMPRSPGAMRAHWGTLLESYFAQARIPAGHDHRHGRASSADRPRPGDARSGQRPRQAGAHPADQGGQARSWCGRQCTAGSAPQVAARRASPCSCFRR